MNLAGFLQFVLYVVLILAVTPPLGRFLYRAYEGERAPGDRWLGGVEWFFYRLGGVDPTREQSWIAYTGSMLAFSVLSLLVTYAILRLQHALPLNPQGVAAVGPELAFNTASSFTTNTNWQSYAGETTMSYLSQMAGLAWHNFTSAAVGMAIAIALVRGLVREPRPDGVRALGNFWRDLVRGTLYVLLPLSFVAALAFVAMGAIQNFSPYVEATTLEGAKQTIAMGPVASQEAIKQLGTNGGGFFNANASHPFENPTPLANLLSIFLIFAIPAALTYTFGMMARDSRQGWVVLAAMGFLFVAGVLVASWAESGPNTALHGLGVEQTVGNLEGKETRFGVAASALYAVITTGASCGAVNSMHDSFTALGGLVLLFDIQLGEVVFGGVGAGLYGILVYAVIAVFIAGLMVGRTPEYLGKKIEAREMKLAMLYLLVFPLLILGFTAWAAVAPYGVSSLANQGPHGLSEMMYAYSSAAGNNGSAFAGLNANTPFWNVTLGLAMLGGRFLMIVPALALAGGMASKMVVVPGPGTFPTHGLLFAALLVGTIVIVGALTFFPALALGPVVEHYLGQAGRLF